MQKYACSVRLNSFFFVFITSNLFYGISMAADRKSLHYYTPYYTPTIAIAYIYLLYILLTCLILRKEDYSFFYAVYVDAPEHRRW